MATLAQRTVLEEQGHHGGVALDRGRVQGRPRVFVFRVDVRLRTPRSSQSR